MIEPSTGQVVASGSGEIEWEDEPFFGKIEDYFVIDGDGYRSRGHKLSEICGREIEFSDFDALLCRLLFFLEFFFKLFFFLLPLGKQPAVFPVNTRLLNIFQFLFDGRYIELRGNAAG